LSLRIGIAKGRGFDDCLQLLAPAGIVVPAEFERGRLPVFAGSPEVLLAQLRGGDLAWLLEQGHLDAVIANRLIMMEHAGPGLVEVATLGIRPCRLSLIVQAGRTGHAIKRVCTRYPNTTLREVRGFAPDSEIVWMSGSHEVSLVLGFADAIVDVVETGWTLAAMGLEEVKVLCQDLCHGIWTRCDDPVSQQRARRLLSHVEWTIGKDSP
jgi:ATP phosphoribosyltransferase